MPSLADIVSQTGGHAWLYLPIAVVLGALHGLEPGHSKTMMAAFIVAIGGTVGQAVLLGLSAALSHTAIVWLVALGGHALLRGTDANGVEPYFQIASAMLVLTGATWMLWRVARERGPRAEHDHRHGAAEAHRRDEDGADHHHQADVRRIDTGHGIMALEIFEQNVPPRWRVRFDRAPQWTSTEVDLLTRRPGGIEQRFSFAKRGDYLESLEPIPEPHEFAARIRFGHGDHVHAYELAFAEPHHHSHTPDHRRGHDHPHPLEHDHDHAHDHDHRAPVGPGAVSAAASAVDPHERAHARAIARRFTDRDVTTTQIVLFGLTGGLIPCPAAITVLLICLQLKRFALAAAVVLCFSAGIAATMVAAGVIAAVGVRHVRTSWRGFDALAARAPYASGALMIAVALYMGASALLGLTHA